MEGTNTTNEIPFSSDLLTGADEVAAFLFGSAKERRRVYHLVETSRIPVFRLGSKVCARRSVLMKWVAEQEQRSVGQARH